MILMLFIALIVFFLGYFLYANYISKVLGVDEKNPVPSVTKNDGIDYVPTNKFVLFGHHFASIAGAGPILGPIIALSMYGWGPVLLWVLVGGVFIGAVHDFSSMVISVKNEGRSIFDISRDVLGKFSSMFMLIFVFLALVIVVAVFSAYTAITFVSEPRIVIPTFFILLSSLLLSFLIYKLRISLFLSTLIGLFIIGFSVILSFGFNISVVLPFDQKTSVGIWIIVLLFYSYIASILPVNLVLQPRDYLNSYLLFIGILFGFIGVLFFGFFGNINIKVPFFEISEVARDPVTGLVEPIWPILFITVACGAISGFHSLIASGTSSKQISNEKDTKFVGYGGMIVESMLAVIVIISTVFFLQFSDLVELVKSGKSVSAFGKGFGDLVSFLLGSWGMAFAILMINGFMLTTLDTATRISRFVSEEIFNSIFNRMISKYISTFFIVVFSGYLALSGTYVNIWKMFGTANQLVAALALVIISIYLFKKGINNLFVLIPAIFMVTTTLGSLVFYIYKYAFVSFNITFLVISLVLFSVSMISYISIIVSFYSRKPV
ncbi:MAG: carbon starvation protein A [Brevinematia bacterium]